MSGTPSGQFFFYLSIWISRDTLYLECNQFHLLSINNMHNLKNILNLLNKVSQILLTLELMKLGGLIFENSWILEVLAKSCRFFVCCPSWLVTTQLNLAQHQYGLTELDIGHLSLGFHFWCIRYPLFLWFNIFSNRMTSNNSSWRDDLKDTRNHERNFYKNTFYHTK